MYFRASDKVSYPVSRIKSYLEDYSKDEVAVQLDDDSMVRVDMGSWEQALRRTGQVISPAAAGFSLLCPVIHEDGSETHDKEPVVAWLLNALGEVLPVTVEGVDLDSRAIHMPNGEVVLSNDCTYPSLENYEATKDVLL